MREVLDKKDATHLLRLHSGSTLTDGKYYKVVNIEYGHIISIMDDNGKLYRTGVPKTFWGLYSDAKVLDLTGIYND